MKATINILAVFLTLAASAAFDSEAWLQKREMLSREAERLATAYTNCVARLTEAAEDVNIPLETFEDGSVKSSVTAKKAAFFLDTGLIWAENVCVRKRDRDGQTVAQIDARNCVIDRVTKSGWADGRARLIHGTTVFQGEGVYFSSPEGYVMVRRGSQIESTDLKFGGVK